MSAPFPFRADDLTLAAMNDVVHTLHPKVDAAHFEVRETFLFGSGQVSTAGRIALNVTYEGEGAGDLPRKVVLKVVRPELGALPLYANEVAFYTRLRPELVAADRPPLWVARGHPWPPAGRRGGRHAAGRRLRRGSLTGGRQLNVGPLGG